VVHLLPTRRASDARRPADAHHTVRVLEGDRVAVLGVLRVGQPGDRREADMVFYQGCTPTGTKTRWKMNEYKAVVADPTDVVTSVPLMVKVCLVQLWILENLILTMSYEKAVVG
jgi:hypothetical protein